MKHTALLLLLSVCAFAQADKGRIVGTVADVSGAIIPEASIVAKDIKTGAEREAKADAKGYYILTNLNPSTYEVTAKGRDLGPNVYKEINLAVGQERTLNIVLQPATVADMMGRDIVEKPSLEVVYEQI